MVTKAVRVHLQLSVYGKDRDDYDTCFRLRPRGREGNDIPLFFFFFLFFDGLFSISIIIARNKPRIIIYLEKQGLKEAVYFCRRHLF